MVLVATQVKRRRGTTAENDAFTGAEGEITVDTERHELRVHDGVTQGGFKIGGGSGSGRNIGDTFMTKRTDTNLAGAVECDGATYNTTDFTGNGSIGELLEAGKLDYVSLSAYSTAIAQTGWCDKIGWDGAGNTQFRVPTINPGNYIIKTQEPTAENNYTWYRKYADGWVEQGGRVTNVNYDTAVSLPVEMADAYYSVSITPLTPVGNMGAYMTGLKTGSQTTTGFNIAGIAAAANSNSNLWQVSGKSSITPQTNTRVMIQLATSATDEALETCTGVLADVAGLKDHRVIAFQAPTADNNYTWYRKYADGWVEQGGRTSNFTNTAQSTGESKTVTLPIVMSGTHYTANASMSSDLSLGNGSVSGYANRVIKTGDMTTTNFIIDEWALNNSSGTSVIACWQVSGMAAQ